MKIVADKNIPFVQRYFADVGELLMVAAHDIDNYLLQDAQLLLVRSSTKVNAELLHDTAVKFVGSVTSGSDHIDLSWLQQRNIHLALASGFNAVTVAEYVMSTIAALYLNQALPKGKLKAGVIGCGRIGSIVANYMHLLGWQVKIYDPLKAALAKDFISCSINELAEVDLISVHVPLTTTGLHPTQHLINHQLLDTWRPDIILINTSRGAVVSTQALLKRTDAHYCLDVWEDEPMINTNLLTQTQLATPHIAGHSKQSNHRGIAMIYDAAVKTGLITAKPVVDLPELPRQKLSFSEQLLSWQEILIHIFDPRFLTSKMHNKLITANLPGTEFIALRNQYLNTLRHEFAYTSIADVRLTAESRHVLQSVNINIID